MPLKPTHKFGEPFACWSVDYIPNLPKNAEGFKHCLVVVDVFSKWVELIPMRSKFSQEVWSALFDQIFSRFGLPKELRCDRGREFAGVVKQKCLEYGIRYVRISV